MALNGPSSPIIPLNAPVLQAQGNGQSAAPPASKAQSTLPLPMILPLTVSIPPSAPLSPPARGRTRRGQRQRSNPRSKAAPVSPLPPPAAAAPIISMRARPPPIPSIAVSPVVAASSPPRPLAPQEVQQVEIMIERCLHLYMNQEEVVMALQIQANVAPSITRQVWHTMEEKSGDFFRAYEVRLKIKEQITAFNYLVSQQAQVTEKSKPGHSGVESGSADTSSYHAASSSSSALAPLSFPFGPFNPLHAGGGGYEPLPSPFSMPSAAPPSFLTSSLSSLLTGVQPVSILNTSTESALTLSTNSLINSFLKSSSDSVLASSSNTVSMSTTASSSSTPSSSSSSSSSLSFAFGPPSAPTPSVSSLSAPPAGPLLSSGSFAMPFISVENMDAPSPFSPFALSSAQPLVSATSLSASGLFAQSGGGGSSSSGGASNALPVPNQLSTSSVLGQQLNGVSPLSASPTSESFLTSSISSIPLTASTNALLDALSGGTSPLRMSPLLTASMSGLLPLNSSLDGFFSADMGSASGSGDRQRREEQ